MDTYVKKNMIWVFPDWKVEDTNQTMFFFSYIALLSYVQQTSLYVHCKKTILITVSDVLKPCIYEDTLNKADTISSLILSLIIQNYKL